METYHGLVRTPADAIILFEACRLGLLPRVQRRLSEKERQAIKSGSVFVWDEREAGMRRWTDGKSWSASRVSGSFLTYREMEGKRGGGVSSSRGGKTPDSRGNSDDDRDGNEEGPDGYRYKPDGLMKQSFSITTSTGQHLHLISYYARSHPTAPNLNQPSNDPALRHIRPQKGLYPESTVNDQQNLPVVTRGPMAGAVTLSPHMAAFPRNGATHPQSYTPIYSWPPTPLGTPPTAPMPYNGQGYLPPLAGGGPYGHPSGPVHQLHTPSDRPHLETTLPPPVPSIAAGSMQPANMSPYSNRSPRSGPAPLEASRVHSPGYAAKPGQYTQIDPRLMSPQSQSQAPPSDNRSSLQPLTPNTSHLPPPNGREAPTSGTTVPSIGSLMNGPAPPPYSKLNGSPSSVRTEGPKDIPSEKIPFAGEDMRAINQLNRVFTV
ncbi:Gti1/Pac2 family-domain-containing protein [Talaromyces proteolyticus]|uniref:Gti1/Pac2 family-domain-containing protein n=1 Tax=Talaromyces proteolyticus TaxID=1131652 RepID=A0AAD4KI72_9EURO|nr:Gti1/Pac2 family-domain-containing protein [Talaromyces proteolyticus]KAH8693022.1 Gti1/Pac2 family-domain-containing protein [Talaromyces proteolyticus]